MPETSRDRIAYWFWCARYKDSIEEMREGSNCFLEPWLETEGKEYCYEAADLVLEMLQSDILRLTTNIDAGDPWNESLRDALRVLGWKRPQWVIVFDQQVKFSNPIRVDKAFNSLLEALMFLDETEKKPFASGYSVVQPDGVEVVIRDRFGTLSDEFRLLVKDADLEGMWDPRR